MNIPICEPDLSGNEKKYLCECIDTGYVSSVGEFVNRFEEMLTQKTGADYAVAVSSGTSALHMALLSVGVSQNDLVIIPSFTFIATANAVSYCGAEPWLFDVKESNWALDSDLLESELSKNLALENGKYIHKETKQKVAAIMPVYTNGMVANIDEICSIAKKYNIPVIADGAAAIGAKYHNKQIGEIDNVELTTLSFNGNKTITCGGGGAVIGNNKDLLDKIRHLSTTAKSSPNYDHDVVGYNYRMTNIQAAVGCAQLERLDEFLNAKSKIYNRYNDIIESFNDITAFPKDNNIKGSNWLNGIIVSHSYDMEAIYNKLGEKGIFSKPFWKPMHMQKPYVNALRTNMNICEDIRGRVLVLPSSTNLTASQLDFVVNTTIKILEECR